MTITHHVRVHRSDENLAREGQLAWALARATSHLQAPGSLRPRPVLRHGNPDCPEPRRAPTSRTNCVPRHTAYRTSPTAWRGTSLCPRATAVAARRA